jgi:hypothetical protein
VHLSADSGNASANKHRPRRSLQLCIEPWAVRDTSEENHSYTYCSLLGMHDKWRA